MINPRKAAAVAVAALALALGVLAAPASAGTHTGTPGGKSVLVSSDVGAVKSPSAASPAFSDCQVEAFQSFGEDICDTQQLNRPSPQEEFVIGTDWAVWHAWPGSNGWHSLGGQAEHFTGSTSGVFKWSDNPYAIWVFGTDGQQWCDNWGAPSWGGWHLCKPPAQPSPTP